MRFRKPSPLLIAALAVGAITFSLAVRAQAQTETQLYAFQSVPDGSLPSGSLIADSSGNLYGTTVEAGNGGGNCLLGCGTVFQLVPNGSGGWTENVLHSFTGGSDGAQPQGSLILDSAGNLYGTAFQGGISCTLAGSAGCGVVFELSPSGGGSWTETVLYNFTGGKDGALPLAALTFDAAGNLYGTASSGANKIGFLYGGSVFQLVPGSSGWTEHTLYDFHGADGQAPASTLVFDGAGNLYGTTQEGGTTCSGGCGVVFKLTPTSSGPWTEKVIHYFNNTNGSGPYSGVTFDAAGNLYGTTVEGGNQRDCTNGCGTAFELSPTSSGNWKQTRLYNFHNTDGRNPYAGVIVDASGNLFGDTNEGGDLSCTNAGCGVVYKLTPGSTGWTETVLHVFGTTTDDGIIPFGGVIEDSSGNLYFTTQHGGTTGYGGAFEITP